METEIYLIAGSGQNVGKTTLACLIIEPLSVKRRVTAIKISRHIHQLSAKQKVIVDMPGLLIADELDTTSAKDSSRFLRAGANRSLFIQADDQHYLELSDWIKKHLTGTVVIETGYFGNFLSPSKAFYIEGNNKQKEVLWKFHYSKIVFDGTNFQPPIQEILTELVQ